MAESLNFVVNLIDRISGGAGTAASSLRHLSSELSESKIKLAFYQAQLNLSKKLKDIDGYRKYSALVAETRKEVFSLGDAVQKAGGPIASVGKGLVKVVEPVEIARHAIEGFASGFRTFTAGLKSADAKEVVSGVSESVAGLSSVLDLAIPGLGQLSSAAIKVTGSFAAMTVGILQSGIELGLEVTNLNDRLEKTFDALGVQGPNSGKLTLAFLNDLSTKLPQTREQLAEYTKTFEALGFTDLGQLRYQIVATASAQAIMGEQGAEAYEHLSRKIRLAVESGQKLKLAERPLENIYKLGLNVTDIATRLGLSVKTLEQRLKGAGVDAQAFGNAMGDALVQKGIGPLQAMGNSLSVLKEKGFETFSHLFDGVDTAPLLDAIKGVISLGDASTPAGKQLKKGFTEGLNGMIKELGYGIQEAEIWFLQLELDSMKAGVSFKNVGHDLRELFDDIKETAKAAHDLWSIISYLPKQGIDLVGGATFAIEDQQKNLEAVNRAKYGGTGGGIVTTPSQGPTIPPPANTSPMVTFLNNVAGAVGLPPVPGHQEGGLVGPAKGERFASVQPGEMIVPKRQVADVSSSFKSLLDMTNAVSSSTGGGGSAISIEKMEVHITAPQGVTDAQALSVIGLTVALERLQLMEAR